MNRKLVRFLSWGKDMVLKVYCIFPLKDAILFESNPDFNDEGYWACKKLIDEGFDKTHKIYWIIKDREKYRIPEGWNIEVIFNKTSGIKELLKKYYVICTSKYIIDTCQFINKKRKGQVRWFILHGKPLKRIDRYLSDLRKYDKFSIGSPFFADYYKSIGFDEKKFASFGMLRNDALSHKTEHLKKLNIRRGDEKIIMWMPTFRQHKHMNGSNSIKGEENGLGIPTIYSVEDLKKINELLRKHNIVFLFKPHPCQNMDYLKMEEMDNIRMITSEQLAENDIQLYEIFNETDGLITDYSSIYFDYLLLDKPIALTVDDIDEYSKSVGFIFDYFKEIKSNFINNTEELIEFIEAFARNDEKLMEHHEEMKHKFNDICDFTSSDKFYEMFMKEIGK